jgi:hypothetical protein
MKEKLLPLAGACLGGLAGYFLFFWIARQGFYGVMLPGCLLGIGAGLSPTRSKAVCVLCGVLALTLGFFTEWRYAPFIKDPSLPYFVSHVHELRPITLIMIVLGGVIGFYGPFQKGKSRMTNDGMTNDERIVK